MNEVKGENLPANLQVPLHVSVGAVSGVPDSPLTF